MKITIGKMPEFSKPMPRKKVIFIAGPFRGTTGWDIELNVREAELLALEVWRAGFVAICPHANTRWFHNVLPDIVWLDGIKEILSRCDGMILTPTWKKSAGTRAEKEFAEQRGIPVFVSIAHLKSHYKTSS